MKPLRGKLVGSAQSARRTQPGGGPAGRGPGISRFGGGPRPGSLPCAPAGRTFSAAVRRDRLWVGLEGPGAKVARLARASELYSAPRSDFAVSPGAVEPLSLRPARLRPGTGPPAPGATVDLDGLPPVRPDRVAPPGRGPALVQRALGVCDDVGYPPDPS